MTFEQWWYDYCIKTGLLHHAAGRAKPHAASAWNAAASQSEADKTAIALLRAWVAGCGDERFSTKEQVKELIDASGDFLASQSDKHSE